MWYSRHFNSWLKSTVNTTWNEEPEQESGLGSRT